MRREQIFDLTGKKALVTGAASGIGGGLARGLAMFGADVACVDVDEAGVQSAAAALSSEFGVKAIGIRCDVRHEDEVAGTIDECVDKLGDLDIVCANAGVCEVPAKASEFPLSEWERVISIDLTGTFLTDKHALRVMAPRRKGKIVNTASTWAWAGSGLIPIPAYTAAKGGVLNMTRELAVEYADCGININAICPGFFRSKIGGFDDSEFVRTVENRIRLTHKIGDPDDLIGAVVFLTSKASDFMTGHALILDSGWLAE